ncbi:MAG: methyl-accepting chemotaxis protein, partial [Treponema sp.]|nr:methyl-accepting chemotaxis protein [Treponema sp.]
MKIKYKLSILMIAIVVAVAVGISATQLRKASSISLDLSKRSILYLTRQRAQYWSGRINGYIQMLHTAADVMGDYENVETDARRSQYEEVIRSIFEAQNDFARIFTVWKPNALDGMDALNIGRPGSTETGQFAYALT